MCFSTRTYQIKANGFTLLEMLVVLVFVGLISTLVMQGFMFSASIYERTQRTWAKHQKLFLQSEWIKDSINGITNGNIIRNSHFQGSSTGFYALSTNSLFGSDESRAIEIEWKITKINERLQLSYVEDPENTQNTLIIHEWQPGTRAYFSYLTSEGQAAEFPTAVIHRQSNKSDVLPKAILLHVVSDERESVSVFSLKSSSKRYSPPVIHGV